MKLQGISEVSYQRLQQLSVALDAIRPRLSLISQSHAAFRSTMAPTDGIVDISWIVWALSRVSNEKLKSMGYERETVSSWLVDANLW